MSRVLGVLSMVVIGVVTTLLSTLMEENIASLAAFTGMVVAILGAFGMLLTLD